MPSDRKKLLVLVCLVVFWIGLMLMQRSQRQGLRSTHVASARRGTSTQTRTPRSPRQGQTKKRAAMPRLKLGRIERVRPPFEPEARNIFASIETSPTLPSPSIPKPQAQAAPTPTAPPPPDPFLEEAKTIRYLGYAEVDGKAMAFVAYGSEAFVVPEKQVFGDKFRVKKVIEDTLILSSLDGTKEVRLDLSPGSGAPPGTEIQRGKKP